MSFSRLDFKVRFKAVSALSHAFVASRLSLCISKWLWILEKARRGPETVASKWLPPSDSTHPGPRGCSLPRNPCRLGHLCPLQVRGALVLLKRLSNTEPISLKAPPRA